MKFKKLFLHAIVSVMATCTILGSVSASANEIVQTIPSDDFVINAGDNNDDNPNERGLKFPTKIWNLSDGVYGEDHSEETGGMFYPLYGGCYTYTGYKFETNTGNLNVELSAYADVNFTNERRLSVNLYQQEKGKSGWSMVINKLFSFTPDIHNQYKKFEKTISFEDLSSDYYYCIRFYNSSPGWATSNDPDYFAIAGDFSISQ